MTPPKLFLSYSWSSPEHEEFVINLATTLVESGVDVKLDKWDLKPGQDAYKYMEQMVTDPDIKKVAIISDRIYAEKADGRMGGVGTETQIISKEVYNETEQEKFVAVVTEKNEQDKAYLPTYFKSRIHFDLSDNNTYAENFERLLRWVFDKPLFVKPEIGKTPAFLNESSAIQLGTNTQYIRAMDALKNHKPYDLSALKDYLNLFAQNLERFRIAGSSNNEFDEKVVESIELFIPYRNEYIQLLNVLFDLEGQEYEQALHRFFENLIAYLEHPVASGTYREWDIDNLKFIVHELYLYTIAIGLKKEAFSYLTTLLTEDYYLSFDSSYSSYGESKMGSFGIIRQYLRSLDHRNQRLNLRRGSLHADLLKDRCQSAGIDFQYLMEADFVLFLNNELKGYIDWYPYTLIYLKRFAAPFEIFARAESTRYFDRIKGFLGIKELTNLKDLLDAYQDGSREVPKGQLGKMFDPRALIGFNNLCKRA